MRANFIKVALEKRDIALFKYIIESYENLATVSTIDPKKAVVEVITPEGNFDAVMEILAHIDEVKFKITETGAFSGSRCR